MMNLREGITDYRYVYTLEQAIQRAPNGTMRDLAARYLATLKKKIPEYAHSSKYSDATNPDAGGSDDEIGRHLDDIRRKIANYIVKLVPARPRSIEATTPIKISNEKICIL